MARLAAPVALVTIGLALAVASVTVGRAHPGWWFAGESDAASALELSAGLALLGAGAAAWRRRPTSRFGPLLFLAGLAWFVPEWNNPAIGSSARVHGRAGARRGVPAAGGARRAWLPGRPTSLARRACGRGPGLRRVRRPARRPAGTPVRSRRRRAARSARAICSWSPPTASWRRPFDASGWDSDRSGLRWSSASRRGGWRAPPSPSAD